MGWGPTHLRERGSWHAVRLSTLAIIAIVAIIALWVRRSIIHYHRHPRGLVIDNPISPQTQYDRLTRALGSALLAYSGLRVFTVARAITSSAARGFSSGASHISPFANAVFVGNSIISYLTILTFIAVVVWVALGLLRQRPSALRAVHVLLPVLLATSTVWLLSELTTGWLPYVAPSPSRPPHPQPWINQAAGTLEFAVMLWAAMIYRRLSDTRAVSDEWRARAAWALSVPFLVSWGWIIYSTQQLRGSILIPLYIATGSMAPQALASLVFRVLPSAALAFVMVADGLRALERDRKAIARLSIWMVAVLVIAIAAGVYVGVVWIAVSHASITNGGSVARYAIQGYASLIGRWIVLPAVSLFMLWKWQRPRALPLPQPQSETEGGA